MIDRKHNRRVLCSLNPSILLAVHLPSLVSVLHQTRLSWDTMGPWQSLVLAHAAVLTIIENRIVNATGRRQIDRSVLGWCFFFFTFIILKRCPEEQCGNTYANGRSRQGKATSFPPRSTGATHNEAAVLKWFAPFSFISVPGVFQSKGLLSCSSRLDTHYNDCFPTGHSIPSPCVRCAILHSEGIELCPPFATDYLRLVREGVKIRS